MISDPLVSVVVPCYNQAKYMSEALDSILNQSFENWECLLVNDGSTDDTKEVANEYCKKDKRFIYFEKKNGGLSSARNFGIRKAKGDFIQFLDSDDILPLEKLRCHIDDLITSNCDIIYGKNKRFYKDNLDNWEYPQLSFPLMNHKSIDFFLRLILENTFIVHSALVKKTVFDRIGYFDETMKCMEDWDFWLRSAHGGCTFFYSDKQEGDVYYRIKDQSMSTNTWNMTLANYIIYNKYVKYVSDTKVKKIVKYRVKELKRTILNSIYKNEFNGRSKSIQILEFLKIEHSRYIIFYKTSITRIPIVLFSLTYFRFYFYFKKPDSLNQIEF